MGSFLCRNPDFLSCDNLLHIREMLKFENYTPENLKKYAPYIKNCPYNVNDVSVGSFFMWNGGVNLKFAVHNGAFISVQDICGEPSFSYPLGGQCQRRQRQYQCDTDRAVRVNYPAFLEMESKYDQNRNDDRRSL